MQLTEIKPLILATETDAFYRGWNMASKNFSIVVSSPVFHPLECDIRPFSIQLDDSTVILFQSRFQKTYFHLKLKGIKYKKT